MAPEIVTWFTSSTVGLTSPFSLTPWLNMEQDRCTDRHVGRSKQKAFLVRTSAESFRRWLKWLLCAWTCAYVSNRRTCKLTHSLASTGVWENARIGVEASAQTGRQLMPHQGTCQVLIGVWWRDVSVCIGRATRPSIKCWVCKPDGGGLPSHEERLHQWTQNDCVVVNGQTTEWICESVSWGERNEQRHERN